MYVGLTDAGNAILFAGDATYLDSDYDYFDILTRVNREIYILTDRLIASRLFFNAIKSEAIIFSTRNLMLPLKPVIQVELSHLTTSISFSW